MEISTEITNQEYYSFIKDYYLKKDWAKRIAMIAIVTLALSIAMLIPISKGWGLLWVYFVLIFIFLMLLFFVVPYATSYFQMSTTIKRTNDPKIRRVFKIDQNGVHICDGQTNKFLPWATLNKVVTKSDFIIFSGIKNQVYPVPLSAFTINESRVFLNLIDGYRKIPGNRRPNPIPLYFVGLLCLIPFIGAIAGLILIINGIGRYKDKILIFIGVVGFFITGYVLYVTIAASKESSAYEKIDPQVSSHTVPRDYKQLLGNGVVFTETTTSKLRGPLSEFTYKGFHGMIYEIDSSYNQNASLGQIIKETNEDVHITYNRSYRYVLNYESLLVVYIIMDRPAAPKNIYFNLYGDQTKTIAKNDSVIYCFSDFKNFAVQYSPAGEQEFFGKASDKDDSEERIPIEVMFFKRKSNLYFIFLVANDKKTNLPIDILYNLIMKKN